MEEEEEEGEGVGVVVEEVEGHGGMVVVGDLQGEATIEGLPLDQDQQLPPPSLYQYSHQLEKVG